MSGATLIHCTTDLFPGSLLMFKSHVQLIRHLNIHDTSIQFGFGNPRDDDVMSDEPSRMMGCKGTPINGSGFFALAKSPDPGT